MMDCVGEVVAAAIIAEVGYQLVYVPRVRLEGATRRQMNISNNLVYTDPPGDVAAFIGLFPQLLCPALILALCRRRILARSEIARHRN